MSVESNQELVDDLIKKIHGNNNFMRLYFTEYKKEDEEPSNIWSKICSCMNWLTIGTEGLEIPKESTDMNKAALEFTHFLVTIDMILEAIEGLWISIGKKQPNIKDRSIFQANELGKKLTDREYFKAIRAWFGIHSVNGNETKVKINNEDVEVRFFSSWSTIPIFLNESEELTFSLILYSNNLEAEKLYGGRKEVKINDLLKFITLRFKSLKQLKKEIDNLYNREKKRLQETLINWDEDKDELAQLNQIHEQAKERKLLYELYEFDIELYKSFLTCDIEEFQSDDRELVLNYLKVLKPIIPIYRDIIQNVDDGEFDDFEKFRLRSQIYFDNNYHFTNVLECTEEWNEKGIISLEFLIDNNILPEYSTVLSGECRELLIYALDYDWSECEKDKKTEHSNDISENSLEQFMDAINEL